MASHIAFLSDVGIRWPPGARCDPVVSAVSEVLSPLSFPDFTHLSMYFHLLGVKENTFGMEPGVKLRLNRKGNELVATCAFAGAPYAELTSWDAKLDFVIDGVKEVLRALAARYGLVDTDVLLYEQLLDERKHAAGAQHANPN